MRERSSVITRRAATSVAIVAVATVWLSPIIGAGQAKKPRADAAPTARTKWVAPRTPWGSPDLQGIWTPSTTTPMERPKEFGTREFLTDHEIADLQRNEARAQVDRATGNDDLPTTARWAVYPAGTPPTGAEYNRYWNDPGRPRRVWKRTSLVVDPPDGQLPPFTAELLRQRAEREAARAGRGEADTWEDRSLWERCITKGAVHLSMSWAGAQQGEYKLILQTPDYVVILIELLNERRIIPLDGRPHLSLAIRPYMGDSRGRWEGDTLVVETTNMRDTRGAILPAHGGLRFLTDAYPGTGRRFRLLERFTRIDPETIEYAYTVDDPETFVRPYTVILPLTNDARQTELYESACHEGNYGMPNLLRAGRANEQAALDGAASYATLRRDELQREWDRLKRWQQEHSGR